jgi:hypothetical protein
MAHFDPYQRVRVCHFSDCQIFYGAAQRIYLLVCLPVFSGSQWLAITPNSLGYMRGVTNYQDNPSSTRHGSCHNKVWTTEPLRFSECKGLSRVAVQADCNIVCSPFVCCQLYVKGYKPLDDHRRDVFWLIGITRHDRVNIMSI